MRIAICDDISEYRLSAKAYINEYFIIRNLKHEIDEFDNGTNLLNSNKIYDILFLDIELGDTNGINIARKIQEKCRNTIIIIITSYRKYLDDAMDLKVFRYIDKPITQTRIFSALDKALSEIHENIVTLHMKNSNIIRIKQSDVVYIEARLKSVNVYCKTEHFQVKETLKQLKDLFSASCFAVPHNSYIVNLNYIKSFKREQICLSEPYPNEKISIATRKQPEFKRQFVDFIGEGYSNV